MVTPSPVLILADPDELRGERRIWGDGGWLEPGARRALDWLTLVALLGWRAQVCGPATVADRGISPSVRWLVIACRAEAVTPAMSDALAAHLAERPALVVTCAAASGLPLAQLAGAAREDERPGGPQLVWCGPDRERTWRLRAALPVHSLALTPGTGVWARLDGAPVIVARQLGRGVIATLGFDPSAARDRAGAVTALLKHMLIRGVCGPVAWLDFSGTMVLRMDDPGGSQNVHLRTWAYAQLNRRAWAEIGRLLARRSARLSVGYVAGWVDDGDPVRGRLELAGVSAPRTAGAVHPSASVRYVTADGTVSDYARQHRMLGALQARGLVSVEPHGYTHLHPERDRWAAAADRYDAAGWYREFAPDAAAALASLPPAEHPLALAIAAVREQFGVAPTTLICPGDLFTEATLELALDLGLQLVGSYYLALRKGSRFCWVQHVCAPYLDRPEAAWFDAELPVVGYFHDRDLVRHGVNWLDEQLRHWAAAGADRWIDYRELAAALGRGVALEGDPSKGLVLHLDNAGASDARRPLRISLRSGDRRLPSSLQVIAGGDTLIVPVTVARPSEGHVQVIPRRQNSLSPSI